MASSRTSTDPLVPLGLLAGALCLRALAATAPTSAPRVASEEENRAARASLDPSAPLAALHEDGGRLDINRAGVRDFEFLPGIGPSMAQRIVEYRAVHGPFASVPALREVRGLGPKSVASLEPLLCAGDCPSRGSSRKGGRVASPARQRTSNR